MAASATHTDRTVTGHPPLEGQTQLEKTRAQKAVQLPKWWATGMRYTDALTISRTKIVEGVGIYDGVSLTPRQVRYDSAS